MVLGRGIQQKYLHGGMAVLIFEQKSTMWFFLYFSGGCGLE